MSAYTVLAVVVVVATACGICFRKLGELSGLGAHAQSRPRLSAPHGRLVRTKRLDNCEDLPFGGKFLRVGSLAMAATLLVLVLGAFGVLDLGGVFAMAVQFVLAVGVAVVLTQVNLGAWRSFAYALAGYALGAVSATLICYYALASTLGLAAAAVNAASMVVGALGASAGAAAMPPMRTYAREFEDGHVNSIQVPARSLAARAYDKLIDAAWRPPADRIQHADLANDARALREALSKDGDQGGAVR